MELLKYIEESGFITREDGLLLALSGGKDSMALLHCLSSNDFRVSAFHFNYNLRDESSADAHFVKEICRKWQIPLEIHEVSKSPNANIQEWARNLRYELLEVKRQESDMDYILTAHHLGDRIESLFLKLLKGRMHSSLLGMYHKSDKLIRPLLDVPQAVILSYLARHEVPYVEDKSNASDKYLRNRIRHHIMPEFRKLSDAYPQNLLKSIHSLEMRETALNLAMEQHMEIHFSEERTPQGKTYRLKLGGIQKEFLPYVVLLISKKLDILIPFALNDEFYESSSGASWQISGVEILKDRDSLLFRNILAQPATSPRTLRLDRENHCDSLSLSFDTLDKFIFSEDSSTETLCLSEEKLINEDLILRKWEEGDAMAPLGMGGKHKKIARILIDEKFSLYEKEEVYLIEDLETSKIVLLLSPSKNVLSEDYKAKEAKELMLVKIRWK